MGKALQFGLVARNRKTNEFEIVKINGKRLLPQEDIDLFTIQFDNPEELSKAINKDGDIDYYLAAVQKRNQKTTIKTNEVVYSNCSNLLKIANDSKEKRIQNSEDDIMALLNLFCRQMSYNYNYYKLVMDGRTDIYDKLARLFYFSRYHTSQELKRQEGSWLIRSYNLARNILESITNEHAKNIELSDQAYRRINEDRVLEQVDPSYNEDQLTVFDIFPDERDDKSKDIFDIINTFSNLSIELIKDQTFIDTLPEEFRETIVTLVKNRTYNEEQSYKYSPMYSKNIELSYKYLNELLKQKEMFTKALNWCKVYNDSRDKDSGDVNGYSYTKKDKQ